ncbi:MAG TPA: HAD hydrolase family protein [Vicinamibacterales bacterium]|jgi:3-deoxy-D-manno-octulosonate 8-phosphate phosphatase (KDO 8-P phosphatase)
MTRLKLLLFDVDGVLTDGTILVHADGSESKSFNIKDGAAMVWAQRGGLRVGLLSARTADATAVRAAQLGLSVVVQGSTDKLAGYERIRAEHGLTDDEIGYMGDDLQDLPVLRRAGFSAAPADAAAEVRAAVHWVSASAGGRGAARECIEHVMRAQGLWAAAVAEFLPR